MQKNSAGRTGLVRIGAGIAVVALSLSACSSSKKPATVTPPAKGVSANDVNKGTATPGGKAVYDMEKQIDDFNILDADGSTDVSANFFNALLPSAYVAMPDYSVAMNKDLLVSGDLTSSKPETLVYKINPKAVWNDGTPITATDFIYTWIVQSGVDANITAASTTGYQNIKSVTGTDDGKTVTVVFKDDDGDTKNSFPDWKALFSPILPSHVAAKAGWDAKMTTPPKEDKGLEDSWTAFSKTMPAWSGGPFQIDPANSNPDGTKLTIIPNPKWYGTKANLDQITFVYVKDATQEPTALANGEADVIYPQPQTGLVNTIKQLDKTKFGYQISKGLTWEHLDFNLLNSFLGGKTQEEQQAPDKLAIRTAMFTAVNRTALIAKTIGLFDPSTKPLNSRMLMEGQPGYADNVTASGLGSGDSAKAAKILTDAGYTGATPGGTLTTKDGKAVPTFTLRYTQGNALRQTECELIQTDMAKIGIKIDVQPTDSLGKTLTQKDATHLYDIILFGFVNTTFPNSSVGPLFISNAKQEIGSVVGANYGFYTNKDVDKWLTEAGTTLDGPTAIADMNKADVQISKDAYTLPLFQKDTMIAFKASLVNVRDNATAQGPAYNIGEWGLKAATAS